MNTFFFLIEAAGIEHFYDNISALVNSSPEFIDKFT